MMSDLSLPTTDSDKVSISQDKPVATVDGKTYAPSANHFRQCGPPR